MTWYAAEILLRASPAALRLVSGSELLAPFAYHVSTIRGHDWYKAEQVHDLPECGLIVVRPVCQSNAEGHDWHDEPILEWSRLEASADAASLLSDAAEQELVEYLDSEPSPPRSLRTALAGMAKILGEPLLYYACGMWAGDIEYEYCLAYRPEESVLATRIGTPLDEDGSDDALRVGLRILGLELPTNYFALHTRSFPWRTHRLLREA
jgi:hypothetical protein